MMRRMVLPQYMQQAMKLMADQLPGILLMPKLQEKLLFGGYALFHTSQAVSIDVICHRAVSCSAALRCLMLVAFYLS